MNRSLVIGTLLLVLVHVAYFAYTSAGLTETLWDRGRGFCFSENDVLHVGMMLWLAYVVFVVGKKLCDDTAVDVRQRTGLLHLRVRCRLCGKVGRPQVRPPMQTWQACTGNTHGGLLGFTSGTKNQP
jgi:hypothetical protein